MNNRDAAKYVKLMQAIRKHEDDIDDLKAKAKELEESLIANMKKANIQRLSIEGQTLWIDRKLWASASQGVSPLAEALREEGLEEMVSEAVNGQRLSSWVREFDPDGNLAPSQVVDKLPPAVRPCIKVSEVYKLAMRKS